MRIIPDSTITLYGGVDIDNGEQLVFSSKANQTAYFQSKIVRASTPCTVVRKTGALRVEIPGSVVSTCNYLSFINPSFDNKIVYARIVDYDYINNECVEISYLIDFWQTWMFDVQFEDSYIEREHLSQADHDKAEVNPYDPTIFEFRTDETLPIAKDLEKLTYEIGYNNTYDGYRVTEALPFPSGVIDKNGILIKLANIDFEDLDSINPTNSQAFADYLDHIVPLDVSTHRPAGGTIGLYWLTDEMGTYLNNRYPTKVINNYAYDSGWKLNGQDVFPFMSSSYHPGCCWIYDPDGGDYLSNCGHMGELLKVLTQYGAEAQIIDLSVIPNRLMFLSGRTGATADPVIAGQTTAVGTFTADCKKLMRYPFSYLRVMSPNGDIKELHYENFKEVQQGQNVCKIEALMDITDRPTLIMAPKKYKYEGINADDTNIAEALTFDQFPTMPYTIDAFTAQVAAVANYTIGNRTVDNAADMAVADNATNKMSQFLTKIKTTLNGVSTGLGTSSNVTDKAVDSGLTLGTSRMVGMGAGFIKGAADLAPAMYNGAAQMDLNRKKFEAQAARWESADSALSEGDASEIAGQLALTKPAYACDKYIPSNGIGAINFSQVSYCDIILLKARLSDEIVAVYDNWFKHFGYSSGRCGIPRVINYSRGAVTDDSLPEWYIVNGKPTTYIKTMDLKVIHAMVPVASYIKNMFDSGVRMIRGDLNGQDI